MVANNQQGQSVMLLQQLATVSSQRDQAPTDPIGCQQAQEQPVARHQQANYQQQRTHQMRKNPHQQPVVPQ
jgi:hypothetical protein